MQTLEVIAIVSLAVGLLLNTAVLAVVVLRSLHVVLSRERPTPATHLLLPQHR